MELPIKAPDSSRDMKTQYVIKAQKLSYWLSPPRVGGFSWCLRRHSPAAATKCILKNVNCEARPGEIMAIAGPSGAGKTTLLEILAGMIPMTRFSGYVLVNHKAMDAGCFRRVSGYVSQDEFLFPVLTVQETLMYSARLRLHDSKRHGKVAVGIRVKELLRELGLEHVANVRIGDESNRGISGGEKRRVSIGVDLVHDPAVLLLDEPTSGLDSASALHVASLLKSMATKQGKTIVLTVHQPGFRILELFDKTLLLSNGTVLHHGPLNLLEQRLRFTGHSIPRHVNVLEFAIDVTQDLLVVNTDESEEEEDDNIEEEEEEKLLFLSRTLQALLAGIVLGTIFMNAASDSIGFFAFSLTFLLSSTTEGLPIYLRERRILMRETSRGAYRISSYFISNAMVFIPFLLFVALMYASPVYWLVGLKRDVYTFLYFTMLVWIVVLMSNSLVACLSALVPDFIMGTSLIAGVVGSFFLFSGYFISREDIPRYWIFMHYLSLFKYPFECFVLNEYGGEKGRQICLKMVDGECYVNGEEFLKQQGLKESQKWSHIVVMLSFIIGTSGSIKEN
ncbi:ABC transporter G family member 10 [Hibiscus syriacus]|uniref:ABC transporter G family member 10 n=1 Tax=Hibiscus syriacus TaxID=106335 RepID=A0A6A3BRR2_HIBSY|nr:ABC transporter G family member 10 [Hibiscus syriacus]